MNVIRSCADRAWRWKLTLQTLDRLVIDMLVEETKHAQLGYISHQCEYALPRVDNETERVALSRQRCTRQNATFGFIHHSVMYAESSHGWGCSEQQQRIDRFGLRSFDGQAAQSTCSIEDGLQPWHELTGEVMDREACQLLELREYWPELLGNRKPEQEVGDMRQVSASGKGTARVAWVPNGCH